MFYGNIWSLLPPLIAIIFALKTKEVYSSLFLGVVVGGLLYCDFNVIDTLNYVVIDGIIAQLSDGWNVGILCFLVLLGCIVVLMNSAGGSAAFGSWALVHIKTRTKAQLATILLGVLIFIDDYFNCLTVGSVMRSIIDKHKISREKLAYLIDATAAPICIIAPISSWAAAVTGFVDGMNGLTLFIRAIPYNFYAFITLAMMVTITIAGIDFGPMRIAEANATSSHDENNNYCLTSSGFANQSDVNSCKKGKIMYLIFPISVLVVSCIIGMIYTGGFFSGVGFIEAFSNSNASTGLVLGAVFALTFSIVFFITTKTLSFTECMNALPEGFKSMVPAILVLALAWTLKDVTDSLGASVYVASVVERVMVHEYLLNILPAFLFITGAFLAFATGTSWGTFGILLPIAVNVFGGDISNELMIISISACMAGAVCGDHCSPISDTTIMASAGAQCKHINHVSTQLPYAICAAFLSFVQYMIAGFVRKWFVCLPLGILTTVVVLLLAKKILENNEIQQNQAKSCA